MVCKATNYYEHSSRLQCMCVMRYKHCWVGLTFFWVLSWVSGFFMPLCENWVDSWFFLKKIVLEEKKFNPIFSIFKYIYYNPIIKVLNSHLFDNSQFSKLVFTNLVLTKCNTWRFSTWKSDWKLRWELGSLKRTTQHRLKAWKKL